MKTNARPRLAVFLPSLDGGGAERAMLNLAIGFSRRGFVTDLVLASATGPYLANVPSEVRVVDLKAQRVRRALVPLVAYLRSTRPSVLLGGLDHASLVAMAAVRTSRTQTRTVISIQCTFPEPGHRAVTPVSRAIPWLLGRFHSWADEIVAVSEGVADNLTRVTGIPRHRVRVIENPGITDGLFRSALEPASHEWFNESTPVVLGVGRLAPQKNFPVLIDAFALVRRNHDARLVILGEGPERHALEERVRRHGLQDSVALPGFVTNPYACMARAATVVLSSDFEGLPTVLIESLALGTPVVSTDCPSGPRKILRDGALGELVPVGDVPALARAIARALVGPRTPPPAEALRPFTVDAVLDQFEEAFGFHAQGH